MFISILTGFSILTAVFILIMVYSNRSWQWSPSNLALLTLYLHFVGGRGKEKQWLVLHQNRGAPIRLKYLQLMDSTGFATCLHVFITSQSLYQMCSCQSSRFHRESPEIFSISRLLPGLHICNSISRDCYLSLHTCIDKTPSFCKVLVSACSKVQLEARHYNTSCERVHIIT